MRIASAQYAPSYLNNWAEYVQKITQWVQKAVADKASLLLFPEYASLELLSLFPEKLNSPYHEQFEQLNSLLNNYLTLYQNLANQYSVAIIPGTFPVYQENCYKNRAFAITPEGLMGYQDKKIMTRFESEDWIITAGNQYQVFNIGELNIGIATCYDAEFPLLVRRLVSLGADIILVPSCTDNAAGYNRVKIGCQSRALENQTLVIQSALIGEAPWCEAIDINYGAAGFFVPPDRGLPYDGILALGELNREGWLVADVDLIGIQAVRIDGQVFNLRDWSHSEV